MTQTIVKKVTLPELIAFAKQKEAVMTDLMAKVNKAVAESKAAVPEVETRPHSVLCDDQIGIMKAISKKINDKRLEHGRIVTDFKATNDRWYFEIIGPMREELDRLLGLATAFQEKVNAEQREAERIRQADIDKRKAQQEAHRVKGHTIDETPREELVPEVDTTKERSALRTRVEWKAKVFDVKSVLKSALDGDGQVSILVMPKLIDAIRQDAQSAVNVHIAKLRASRIKLDEEHMLVLPGIKVEKVTSVI